jgi:RNA polymerase sigma-70 factor (ECF subfamily)
MEDDVRYLLQARRYERALERLLDLYEKKVFQLAVVMLRDRARAEEITQDVFLKVWRALPSYDGRAALSTWIYTIARHTCLSAMRNESYRRTDPLDESREPAIDSTVVRDVELGQGLARLPEVMRHVITLFYLQDRSVKEVAALLDLPEGTVKSHLHRARRALGEMMK